ncbi:exportin-T-like [Sycon ciliatum]|uniref:exportin-T-like n=1 Tax=Sycon ciliatum TaxID=27933 RepID=UPI0020AD747E|eukprot:scpid26466/ scgid19588/ Exportin-T; Exportin(tRNA); tRNA exportin
MDLVTLLNVDSADPRKAEACAEQLKSSEDGWKICGDTFARGLCRTELAKFLCLHVLENFIVTRYNTSTDSDHQYLRQLLLNWLQQRANGAGSSDESFVLNKVAHVFALSLVAAYPAQWPTFFEDLLSSLKLEHHVIDMYLRILSAIDKEVVDREMNRNDAMLERNTLIKDHMRTDAVPRLVDSWYEILTASEADDHQLACTCLDVVGMYVEWIDIGLIANSRYTELLLRFMTVETLRENACLCFHEILNKGMDPDVKVSLTESLAKVLEASGILPAKEDEDPDFLAALAKLVGAMGVQLVSSYNKLSKAGAAAPAAAVREAIDAKLTHMFKFLSDEGDDISQHVIPFFISYLTVLKAETENPRSNAKESVQALLYIVIMKMKYDESYCFDDSGEDEAMFLEYRHNLKVVFDNIAQLNPHLLLETIYSIAVQALQQWQTLPFNEVEVAIRSIYLIGEVVPGSHFSADKPSLLKNMMEAIVTSRVSFHSHPEVAKQFFETVVRYEKFFQQNSSHIADALSAFLDRRGLLHDNAGLRSRVCYLLSRFVKSVRTNLQNIAGDVLKQLQSIMAHHAQSELFSYHDQLFLYETAGILIIGCGTSAEATSSLMKEFLAPLVSSFRTLLSQLCSTKDDMERVRLADGISHVIAFTGRVSKTFSSQQTMKQCGCVEAFCETIPVFLEALDVPFLRDVLHAAVRQYLHRMIVCLESSVLPFIPAAISQFLKDAQIRDTQEFIPLINQLVLKFKTQLHQLYVEVFVPLVKQVFGFLNAPVEQGDQQAQLEKVGLHKAYFTFLAVLINNGLASVIAQQEASVVHDVILSIVQATTETSDLQTHKTCFILLRKLCEAWSQGEVIMDDFDTFVYEHVIPACFLSPLQPGLSLQDAHVFMALSENGTLMKIILAKEGSKLLHFLQAKYLPSLNLPPELAQEYCEALQQDIKVMRTYLKAFFSRLQQMVRHEHT